MENPPRGAGREKASIDGGTAILDFPRSPRNLTNCIACGDHFRQSRAWHLLCVQCFALDCVWRACAQFNDREQAQRWRP